MFSEAFVCPPGGRETPSRQRLPSGQRHPWTETTLQRLYLLWIKPNPWTETPLVRDPPGQKASPGQRPSPEKDPAGDLWREIPSRQRPPPDRDLPLDRDPLPSRQRPPGLTSSGGHCSGLYASYWNAFLFFHICACYGAFYDAHTHTHTHTHPHIHTHAHIHTHIHTHTHTYTYTHRHRHRHTDTYTHTQTHAQTHRHRHTVYMILRSVSECYICFTMFY